MGIVSKYLQFAIFGMKKNWKRNINNTLENIVELHFTHAKKSENQDC